MHSVLLIIISILLGVITKNLICISNNVRSLQESLDFIDTRINCIRVVVEEQNDRLNEITKSKGISDLYCYLTQRPDL